MTASLNDYLEVTEMREIIILFLTRHVKYLTNVYKKK